ncbi:uncharacterized protein LOC108116279 [Drosophila eugracilis]|uniref:uncharacterized protein LOC108116279 n=1 Tax=Drosophila eugracilis TaxID=29029 RepID=UPI0007E7D0D5|nr:uncharacterized protein LOC108116279 [Drosophila eugracilis]
MNSVWREIGFARTHKPKKHLRIVRIKKRIAKARKIFNERQNELIQLHFRNRMKSLIIKYLENKLEDYKNMKRIHKSLK